MRIDDGIDNVVHLHEARGTGADLTGQLALFPAGDRRPPATLASAPAEPLRSLPSAAISSWVQLGLPGIGAVEGSLASRLARAPGLVRAGASRWDDGRTPIHPLSVESAYADPALLRDLGVRGARFARDLGVDVVVGAETAGVPLAAAVSLAAGVPFAFVHKPGYRGHEVDEPPVRGAEVAGRRVLLIDDAIASGSAVERFTAALAAAGAEVAGVFVLVDMREVADTVSGVAAALPTEAVSSYLQVLDLATTHGVLDPAVHELSLDAILNRWSDDDPRWELLPAAA